MSWIDYNVHNIHFWKDPFTTYRVRNKSNSSKAFSFKIKKPQQNHWYFTLQLRFALTVLPSLFSLMVCTWCFNSIFPFNIIKWSIFRMVAIINGIISLYTKEIKTKKPKNKLKLQCSDNTAEQIAGPSFILSLNP